MHGQQNIKIPEIKFFYPYYSDYFNNFKRIFKGAFNW